MECSVAGIAPRLSNERLSSFNPTLVMFPLSFNRTIQHRLLTSLFLVSGLLVAEPSVFHASAQQPVPSADTVARKDTTKIGVSSERKSSGRALLYSVGGTVLLLPAGGVGVVIGPAVGHFYAANSQQARAGIAIRTGGAGAVGIGGVWALGAPRVGWGLLTGGALVVAGSALYDIVTAPRSAHEYNKDHSLSAQVAPTVGPRGEQVGLALRISF